MNKDGISHRYEYNKEFFNVWSHDLAYIVGFWTADGCLTYNKERKQYIISTVLKSTDVEVLEFIRNKICPTKPIANKVYFDKRHNKTYHHVRLDISNKYICDKLVEFGMTPRKTSHEVLPIGMPNEYFGSFVLGLFDGDGSITQRKSGGFYSQICSGSKDFLTNIQYKLGFGRIYAAGPIFSINMCCEETFRFRDLIYKNSDFSLSRKRDIMFSVNKLDIVKMNYTDNEIEIIKKYYGKISNEELAKKLEKTVNSIMQKACNLKLTKNSYRYSEKDIEFIKDIFDINNYEQTCLLITNKLGINQKELARKTAKMGLREPRRKFTESEISYINANSHKNAKMVAKELGLSYYKVYNYMKKSGLTRVYRGAS